MPRGVVLYQRVEDQNSQGCADWRVEGGFGGVEDLRWNRI
jgi:hypothetical protein